MNILFKIRRKIYKAFHPVMGEVWMLHRCCEERSDDPKQRELEVTPAFLEQKILEYKKKGYEFISIDEVISRLRQPLIHQYINTCIHKKRFVCVTFDDGYRDNLLEAMPVLKKQDVPFVVYLTTDFVDNKKEMWWYPGEKLALSMSELLELNNEPLCTIGAHTLSHPRLSELALVDQVREIEESKRLLELWIEKAVRHFSYPHGAHTIETVKIAEESGFVTILCAWGGPVRVGIKTCSIPRISIVQH